MNKIEIFRNIAIAEFEKATADFAAAQHRLNVEGCTTENGPAAFNANAARMAWELAKDWPDRMNMEKIAFVADCKVKENEAFKNDTAMYQNQAKYLAWEAVYSEAQKLMAPAVALAEAA